MPPLKRETIVKDDPDGSEMDSGSASEDAVSVSGSNRGEWAGKYEQTSDAESSEDESMDDDAAASEEEVLKLLQDASSHTVLDYSRHSPNHDDHLTGLADGDLNPPHARYRLEAYQQTKRVKRIFIPGAMWGPNVSLDESIQVEPCRNRKATLHTGTRTEIQWQVSGRWIQSTSRRSLRVELDPATSKVTKVTLTTSPGGAPTCFIPKCLTLAERPAKFGSGVHCQACWDTQRTVSAARQPQGSTFFRHLHDSSQPGSVWNTGQDIFVPAQMLANQPLVLEGVRMMSHEDNRTFFPYGKKSPWCWKQSGTWYRVTQPSGGGISLSGRLAVKMRRDPSIYPAFHYVEELSRSTETTPPEEIALLCIEKGCNTIAIRQVQHRRVSTYCGFCYLVRTRKGHQSRRQFTDSQMIVSSDSVTPRSYHTKRVSRQFSEASPTNSHTGSHVRIASAYLKSVYKFDGSICQQNWNCGEGLFIPDALVNAKTIIDTRGLKVLGKETRVSYTERHGVRWEFPVEGTLYSVKNSASTASHACKAGRIAITWQQDTTVKPGRCMIRRLSRSDANTDAKEIALECTVDDCRTVASRMRRGGYMKLYKAYCEPCYQTRAQAAEPPS